MILYQIAMFTTYSKWHFGGISGTTEAAGFTPTLTGLETMPSVGVLMPPGPITYHVLAG